MSTPPSAINVEPCTKSAAGETSHAAHSAICSAVPTLPTALITSCRRTGSLIAEATNGVSMKPGATAFTAIPRSPSARAALHHREHSALARCVGARRDVAAARVARDARDDADPRALLHLLGAF